MDNQEKLRRAFEDIDKTLKEMFEAIEIEKVLLLAKMEKAGDAGNLQEFTKLSDQYAEFLFNEARFYLFCSSIVRQSDGRESYRETFLNDIAKTFSDAYKTTLQSYNSYKARQEKGDLPTFLGSFGDLEKIANSDNPIGEA